MVGAGQIIAFIPDKTKIGSPNFTLITVSFFLFARYNGLPMNAIVLSQVFVKTINVFEC